MNIFPDDERKNIAYRLVKLADAIPIIKNKIQDAGFTAHHHIEAFELSFCKAEEIQLRARVLLEEARERLGSTTWVLFRTEDGQGDTIYISSLLESMRQERDKKLFLPIGGTKPNGWFNYNYYFFEPRRRKDLSLLPGQDGMKQLNQAWEKAYHVMDEEGQSNFPEIPDTRSEGIGIGFEISPNTLARFLEPLGFDLPSELKASSYIVARLKIDRYWLLFCVDVRHPMQPRFFLTMPYEKKKYLLERRIQIQIPLNECFLDTVGGSAPYSHPKTPRQFATSTAYYACVLKCLVPQICETLVGVN